MCFVQSSEGIWSKQLLNFVAAASFAGGAKLGPKEQAYIAVVKQLNLAAAQHTPVDPIAAFGSACEQYEDKTPDTLMSNCWKLLGDILSVARARGLAPGQDDYVEALLEVCFVLDRSAHASIVQSITPLVTPSSTTCSLCWASTSSACAQPSTPASNT